MTTLQTLDELIEKYELEMRQLETDKDYTFSVYNKVQELMNSCLESGEYTPLFELLPYFEAPDSYPHFHLSAETRRVHILLNILKLEMKYDKLPFLSSVDSYSAFLIQYTQTVFALRRLELSFLPEAMEEASLYLTSIPFSIYAAKLITENEYFENFETLYWNLYCTMETIWSVQDKLLWLNFLLEKVASSNVILELASLSMDIGDYKQAYEYLTSLPTPPPQVTELIITLKELLCDERK